MIDLLLEPAKLFIEKGLDAYRKTKEHENLRLTIQDRIRREIRYNQALLTEIVSQSNKDHKHDEQIRLGLIRALRTDAFDDADSGIVPLSLFFEQALFDSIWPTKGFEVKKAKYLDWLAKVQTQYALLERAYHRIRIARYLRRMRQDPRRAELHSLHADRAGAVHVRKRDQVARVRARMPGVVPSGAFRTLPASHPFSARVHADANACQPQHLDSRRIADQCMPAGTERARSGIPVPRHRPRSR